MRILLISDIHANLTALESVLADAGAVDEVWCLGDLVGYGPDANEVVARVRALPHLFCLAGNHDVAIADETFDITMFNKEAYRSVIFQRKVLSPENREFLLSLPRSAQIKDGVTLAHGSPRDSLWEYILTGSMARKNFSAMQTDWAFVGHTHLQGAFLGTPERAIHDVFLQPGEALALGGYYWILNQGSVGQPRDGDARAAYAIYEPDNKRWTPHRVAYDIAAVQERMRALHLPLRHIERLEKGR